MVTHEAHSFSAPPLCEAYNTRPETSIHGLPCSLRDRSPRLRTWATRGTHRVIFHGACFGLPWLIARNMACRGVPHGTNVCHDVMVPPENLNGVFRGLSRTYLHG